MPGILGRLRRPLGWIVAAIILALLVRPIALQFGTVQRDLTRPDWAPLLLGAVLVGAYFLLRFELWFTLTRSMDPRPGRPVAVRVWFLSEFTRYVPGNVWSFIGRAGAYRVEGVPIGVSTVALLREAVTIVATAAIVLTLALAVDSADLERWDRYAVAIGAAGTVLLLGLLLPVRIRGIGLPFGTRGLSLFLGVAAWLAFGYGNALILRAFHAPGSLLQLGLLGVAAWLVGYCTLLTPSGLGVREAVLAQLLLNASGSLATASALAITSRLVLILVEVAGVGLVLSLLPRTRSEGG